MNAPDRDLLQELEESLPQGVPNATNYTGHANAPATVEDDGLASLDALLEESVEEQELRDQYKRDRESRKRGYAGLSKEEVDFCNSRMAAFEMAREWDADRAIAVFHQIECGHCGAVRHVFSRLMEHHQHRHVKTTQRWITVAETKLPTKPVMDARDVPVCVDCMGDFEMDPDIMQWPWFGDEVGVEQDD